MTDQELMQQALDMLEKLNKDGWILADFEDEVYASIEALRARLAQPESAYLIGARLFREGKGISFIPTVVPSDNDIGEALQGWEDAKTAEEIAQPEPEPVAWWDGVGRFATAKEKDWDRRTGGILSAGRDIPLYTTPPQREWQGLTDEEIEKLYLGSFDEGQFAHAIEAKLKEKNT